MRRALAALLLLAPSLAFAGGFIDHRDDGTPYTWKSFPITYKTDTATTTVEGFAFKDLVDASFATWAAVPEATVSFSNAGEVANITDANIDDYIVFDDFGAPRSVTTESVIVFDEDGAIMNFYFGEGSADLVLGLASPGTLVDADASITTGLSIMNGKGATSTDLKATMVHEFGHLLNLAHTQLNVEEYSDSVSSNDNVIPTMFPILPQDALQTTLLNLDDQFSLAMLYPNSAALNAKGSLSGRIVRRSGAGVRAVNVICRDESNPRENAVSWISDMYLTGEGEYTCGNLPDGNYSVWIEPIFFAINIYDPDPPFIAPEFYNGDLESFDPEVDDRTESVPVAVTGGVNVAVNDLVINEDGRLVSGTAVTGQTAGFFPELEYFIKVPASATRVTFDLVGENQNLDLDILGRCDGEFSLPFDSTAAPLLSSDGTGQQAEFSTSSSSGTEQIVLDRNSSPSISACTYHLLIANYDSSADTAFTLKATIEGASPVLTLAGGVGEVNHDGTGEFPVLSRKLSAQDDTFRFRTIRITDQGTGDLSQVTAARLYYDADQSGTVSSGDEMLTTSTSIDSTARTIDFSFAAFYVPDGEDRFLLVTYNVPAAAAGFSWILGGFLIAVVLLARRRPVLLSTFAMFLLLNCSDSDPKVGFHPTIASTEDVGARGETFGDQYKLRDISNLKSVSDFFE